MKPYRPLWDQDREQMIRDFLDLGFKPLVIVADNRLPELVGQVLDHAILDDLKARYERSAEQERIYYHTFVIDGPMFNSRLEITDSAIVPAGGISYLDMKAFELKPHNRTV
jgi:diphthamide synthase (EF-2-diphthine--ammonia ligase)